MEGRKKRQLAFHNAACTKAEKGFGDYHFTPSEKLGELGELGHSRLVF